MPGLWDPHKVILRGLGRSNTVTVAYGFDQAQDEVGEVAPLPAHDGRHGLLDLTRPSGVSCQRPSVLVQGPHNCRP